MYQLVTGLLQPYTFLLLSLLAVLFVAWRRQRQQRWLLSISLGLAVLLCILSMPAISYLAIGCLEWPYPPSNLAPAGDDMVVVLSGNMQADNKEGTRVRLGNETLQRCLHAARLYHQAGGCRILVTGGRPYQSQTGLTLAEAMRDFLIELGIDPTHLLLEPNSSSTFENARNSSDLLREHPSRRVFLVTSAPHMGRAVRCFKHQGITVVPASCNHQALRLEPSIFSYLPTADGIRGMQRAMHEWLGLVWYWLNGRI